MLSSSALIFLTVLALMAMVSGGHNAPSHIKYSTVTGYFLQDDPNTQANSFNYTTENFGLINRTYETDAEYDPSHKKTQWQRFEHQVFRLNRQSGRNVQYKVLYMGRHGEGLHNVAESFYGTPAWNCYWSKLDGNGTIAWADAHLTDEGVKQALIANSFWATEIATQKIPVPETYYTSPLDRCLATANITFSGLSLPGRKPFLPVVKELLREAIGIHTCDRRSTKTWIHGEFPLYRFEAGFAENDPLWKTDVRETDSALDARMKSSLDDVFSHDDSTYISFTSHSGAIGGILRVLGHRQFSLVTGAVIPVLVKAETIYSAPPATSIAPSATAPACTANPTAACAI